MQKPSIIILAGGLGTRLRSVVADMPKCMAPVHGKPFISYLIDHFHLQGVGNFIFSLGYKHEVVEAYLEEHYPNLHMQFSIEEEPLGTGGAIKKACSYTDQKNVIIANGDTMFKVKMPVLYNFHLIQNADCTLALKPMKNFERYGVIELNEDHSIKTFSEKKYYDRGLINGGLYMLNVDSFLSGSFPEKFSFETDYLEKCFKSKRMYGLVQDEYFIDIGIPEDYAKAQQEL